MALSIPAILGRGCAGDCASKHGWVHMAATPQCHCTRGGAHAQRMVKEKCLALCPAMTYVYHYTEHNAHEREQKAKARTRLQRRQGYAWHDVCSMVCGVQDTACSTEEHE